MSNSIRRVLLLALTAAAPAFAAQPADGTHGKQVFDSWCAPCHAPGPKHPGTQALQVLYKGEKPASLEQRLDLTPEMVAVFVRKGVSIMPFFRKTEISDKDLADLGAYLAIKPAR
ncbi:MAG TPA: cytochrome c [Candidatus Acidoferrum sp.]|nr:cytochrome c [Candidatus Acidoferrum sp.]